jgi:hypothetical protein
VNAGQESRILKSFVRGEAECEALTALGAKVSFDVEQLQVTEPADAPVYEPSVADVATGLLAHSVAVRTLRDWARVLLATGMIDLRGLEDHPDGEVLLEAVWDAAEGTEIVNRQLELVRRLAASG